MVGRSTVTNLMEITQYLSHAIDNRGQVDVIYTDFAKAFDSINHKILISKLRCLGFSEGLILFFQSYLNHRQQYVAHGGYTSDLFTVHSGVPQGSNLGPLLFLIFVNDILDNLSCEKLMFADDLKIFCRINSPADCILLQEALDNIEQWSKDNSINLNPQKCSIVSYNRKTNPIVFQYSICGVQLSRCENVKDLGIHFDNKLTFSYHINKTKTSAVRALGFLIRNCKNFTNATALNTLFSALVKSKLDYGILIWYPHYSFQKSEIESIQRKYLKFLSFRLDSVYPERGCCHNGLLKRFGFISLEKRMFVFSVIFLYNLLNNKVDSPSLLSQLNFLVPRTSSRSTKTFYCTQAHTNILVKSPLVRICENFNKICGLCDINYSSVKNLIDIITNEQLYSVPTYYGRQ